MVNRVVVLGKRKTSATHLYSVTFFLSSSYNFVLISMLAKMTVDSDHCYLGLRVQTRQQHSNVRVARWRLSSGCTHLVSEEDVMLDDSGIAPRVETSRTCKTSVNLECSWYWLDSYRRFIFWSLLHSNSCFLEREHDCPLLFAMKDTHTNTMHTHRWLTVFW